jgi:hypothetical protein
MVKCGLNLSESLRSKLLIVLLYILFVCKCVLYYCHRVSTQLQLTNILYHYEILAGASEHRNKPLIFHKIPGFFLTV